MNSFHESPRRCDHTHDGEPESLHTGGILETCVETIKKECIPGDEKSASNFGGRRADTNEKRKGGG